jgi:hypothetical protein
LPGFQFRRRRRPQNTPNKNALKVARQREDDRKVAQSATLGQKYPHVVSLEISWQMTTPDGSVLAEKRERVDRNAPILFDVACQGLCGNGLFLLTDGVDAALRSRKEVHEGRGVCQGASYNDPRGVCGTRLQYRIGAVYED